MKRYPAYRDSGVEWLGELPVGWEVCPLKTVTVARCDGPFGSGLKSDHYTDEGTRVIRLQNIRSEGFDDADRAFISNSYAGDELQRHEVRGGDLLIAGLGDDNNMVGRCCIAPKDIEPAIVKADCFRFRLDLGRVSAPFAAYSLNSSATFDAGRLATGTTRARIPLSQMGMRRLPLPPLPEQWAIAAFLDRETVKIDALVAEHRRLIELLREKRQAVISHAVTRGLDPTARLKPSGVDWLGEVPEGWEVVPARRIIQRMEQGKSPECDSFPAEPGSWGVLKTGCVNRGFYNEAENKFLPAGTEPHAEYEVKSGDVLMSRASGSPDLIGSVARVRNTQGRILLSDKIFRLHLGPDTDPNFVVLLFGSRPLREQIVLAISGGEGMANNLPQSSILEMICTKPPVEEQAAISAHLRSRRERYDNAMNEAESAIVLLQERRAAFISAAVTGKIDVREAAASPETEAA